MSKSAHFDVVVRSEAGPPGVTQQESSVNNRLI